MKKLILCFVFSAFLTGNLFAVVLYSLDFSKAENGNAEKWFENNDFDFRIDADDFDLSFENNALILKNEKDNNGLMFKQVKIENVKRLRIEWGVNKYPKGIDWEKGMTRDAIMVLISFGTKNIDSGSFVVPNVPYFIGYFLGEKEIEGKAYKGQYFQKGGRYVCQPCGVPAGETVVTEVNIEEQFKQFFDKGKMPDISAVAIESDTRDLKEASEAFIKKIEFLSE